MQKHILQILIVSILVFLYPLNSFVTSAKTKKELNNKIHHKQILISKKPPVRIKKPIYNKYNCTHVSGDDWEGVNQNISVGLRAFTAHSRLSLSSNRDPQHMNTCEIIVNTGNFKSIYAIPDDSVISGAKITAYLDGKEAISIRISKGEADTLSVNTEGYKSIAIGIDADISPELVSFHNRNRLFIYEVMDKS
jgi:hypothetical protein